MLASFGSFVFFCIICLFFGSHKVRSKKTRYLYLEDVFCLGFLIVLMGCRSNGPDWDVYSWIYNSQLFKKDIGFGYFVLLCKKLNFSLYQMRLFIAFVGISLIYCTARKYLDRKYIKWFYLIYVICPFFLDGIQLRNFIGMALLVFAVPFLVNGGWKGEMIYLILVILASLMQKTFLIYIPLVFINLVSEDKFLRYLGFFVLIFFIILGLNKNLVAYFEALLLRLFADSLDGVSGFLTEMTNWGWLFSWVSTALSIFTTGIIKESFRLSDDVAGKRFVEGVYLINLYTTIALPLYVMSTNFYRIGRNVQVLNIVVFCLYFQNVKNKQIHTRRDNELFVILFVVMQIAFIAGYVLYAEYWDLIVLSAFRSNWFFIRNI